MDPNAFFYYFSKSSTEPFTSTGYIWSGKCISEACVSHPKKELKNSVVYFSAMTY